MEFLTALQGFLKDTLNDQLSQTILLIFVFAKTIGLKEDLKKARQQIESLSESVRQQKSCETPHVRMSLEEGLRAMYRNRDAAEQPTSYPARGGGEE